MKKNFLIVVIISLFVSCEQNTSTPEPPKTSVGMINKAVDFNDDGFLSDCQTGLSQAQIDYNLQVVLRHNFDFEHYQEKIDYFGINNFQLVYAVDPSWLAALTNTAWNFPNTSYVFIDGVMKDTLDNVLSLTYNVDEPAFMCGFIAAYWAYYKDNDNPAVAFAAAIEAPSLQQYSFPFTKGAKYFEQRYGIEIDTLGLYGNGLDDEAMGEAMVVNLVSNGADIIFGIGGKSGEASLKKTRSLGKWGIGFDTDMFHSVPEVSDILITSCMKKPDVSIYATTKSFIQGDFQGGTIFYGNLENNNVGLAPYHNFDHLIPDTIKQELEIIKGKIIQGEIITSIPLN